MARAPPLIPIQTLICCGLKKHGEAGIWHENQASELPLTGSPGSEDLSGTKPGKKIESLERPRAFLGTAGTLRVV